MNATTPTSQISADGLYDLVKHENIWPQNRRVIYCNRTGKAWGIVSDDYVRYAITNFNAAVPLDKFIDRITLFSGPSPMWQEVTPAMLTINQHADPIGFLVYLLNWSLRLEPAAMEAKKNDIDAYIEWRKGMTRLYSALEKLDRAFIHKVNDMILIMTGEGLYPQPHMFPSRELEPYGNKETLEKLMRVCKSYYDKYRGRYNVGPGGTQTRRPRHEIHARTYNKTYDTEKVNTKLQFDMVSLMLAEVFAEMDAVEPLAEVKRAKQTTGIASPTFMELKRIADEQKLNPPKKQATVYSAGQKIVISIKKKEE